MKQPTNIFELRDRIPEDIFDYQTLRQALQEYARPRNRISAFLKSGAIVRVKKGLYVFGPRPRRRLISREILSNLVYGPSYISREYALSYYGLIPEAVPTLTAMTTGRARMFHTPLGVFSYSALPRKDYSAGVTIALADEHTFFIASPEKALADLAFVSRGLRLRSRPDVERFLVDDLRIDLDDIRDFSPRIMRDIAGSTSSPRVRFLMQTLIAPTKEAVYA